MAKTILISATLHVRDDKRSTEIVYGPLGDIQSGRSVVIAVPPSTPVRFEDGDEADRLIIRHKGEETDLPPAITVKARGRAAGGDSIIPLALATLAPETAPPKSAKATKGSDPT